MSSQLDCYTKQALDSSPQSSLHLQIEAHWPVSECTHQKARDKHDLGDFILPKKKTEKSYLLQLTIKGKYIS